MPERDIRKALKERVEAYGGEIRAMAWLGRRHAPDVLCLFPLDWSTVQLTRLRCTHPFVECKAPGGKPTPAQAREHARMKSAGCDVLVISTLEQLDDWLPPR
jgi:hypothetical protein